MTKRCGFKEKKNCMGATTLSRPIDVIGIRVANVDPCFI